MKNSFILLTMILLLSALSAQNSCITCHSEETPDLMTQFKKSVHYEKGIMCQDCHGGNAAKADMDEAMSARFGFKEAPSRNKIAKFCDKCHGDLEYMRRFNPSARVDQYKEYLTSVHGKMMKKGHLEVATCSDCHTSHMIMGPEKRESTVNPKNVAKTCGNCHDDIKRMKKFNLPVNQHTEYMKSIHAITLYEKNDLSAPTCNDCHGNHGAVPPGIRNVSEVCGTCHRVQADFFEKSFHSDIFEDLGEPGCVTCHSNHKINRFTNINLSDWSQSVCAKCHEENDEGWQESNKLAAALKMVDSSFHELEAAQSDLEKKGMDVMKLSYNQQLLKENQIKMQVAIHGMSEKSIADLVTSSKKTIEKSNVLIATIQKDIESRKRGLVVSLIIIALTMLSLHFYRKKIIHK